MPVYEYHCVACGKTEDHVRPYEYRLDPLECRSCRGTMVYRFAGTVHQAGEIKRGDNRFIWSEKQLDRDWRNEGVTGPGGAGKTLYFHD